MRYTIITGCRSVCWRFYNFQVCNSGPENHQEVALRSGADLSVFYRCKFEGYQDTLYSLHPSQRQFYRECYVYRTVDFFFGNAAAVLQNCMHLRKKAHEWSTEHNHSPGPNGTNQNTGISIHDSRVMATPNFESSIGSVKTFLGGPWKESSKFTVDNFISGSSWLPAIIHCCL
ncbi:hypothetical protein EV1_001667 [Malus domestica]